MISIVLLYKDSMDPWKLVPVDPHWLRHSPNPTGMRDKHWLRDPENVAWLCKRPRESRPTESVVEPLCAALGRSVGLETPETHTAMVEGRPAVLVRRFEYSHTHGAEILQRFQSNFDPNSRHGQRLGDVREALTKYAPGVLLPFTRMLAFDAWVGNGDRHSQNWALHDPPDVLLTPVFDTACCLACEIPDDELGRRFGDDRGIRRYVMRCSSGFGTGTSALGQPAVVEELRTWPEWKENVQDWIARFEDALPLTRLYLDGIPPEWLSDARKAVICRILVCRLDWLKEHAK